MLADCVDFRGRTDHASFLLKSGDHNYETPPLEVINGLMHSLKLICLLLKYHRKKSKVLHGWTFLLKKETNNYPIQKKYLQRISCQLTDFLFLPFHSSSLIYTHILFPPKSPILYNLNSVSQKTINGGHGPTF